MKVIVLDKNDIVEFNADAKEWRVTHEDSSFEGAPSVALRIAPDMLFALDRNGFVTILKSSLKHYSARECIERFNYAFNQHLDIDNVICERIDSNPKLAMHQRLTHYHDMLLAIGG
jgi:hypothetical protein